MGNARATNRRQLQVQQRSRCTTLDPDMVCHASRVAAAKFIPNTTIASKGVARMNEAMKRLMLVARWRMNQNKPTDGERWFADTAFPPALEPMMLAPINRAIARMSSGAQDIRDTIDADDEPDWLTPKVQAAISRCAAMLHELCQSRGIDQSSDMQRVLDRAIDRAIERYIASYRAVPGPRRKLCTHPARAAD